MDNKKSPYWRQVLVAAPAFGAKTLVSDLPKGTIEQVVESKVSGSKLPLGTLFRQGGLGRGGGRALGGALGILTAPLYLRGLQLAASKDRKERLKGLGLIAGSGSIAVGQKGLVEGYRAARSVGTAAPKALAQGAKIGLFRAGYKTPLALLMASSLVRKKKDTGAFGKYVKPALMGGALGGVGRGAESFLTQAGGRSLRAAIPAAVGGVASGLLGGLVLGGAVDMATRMMNRDKEKKASHPFGAVLQAVPADRREDVERWIDSKLVEMGRA